MVNVAVYGTLLKGFHNHRLLEKDSTTFLGNGIVTGFDMFDLGSFPAILHGNGEISVEVYNVSQEVADRLDMLEGYHGSNYRGNLYDKNKVSVEMVDPDSGEAYEVPADIYVYSGTLYNRDKIESGDYRSSRLLKLMRRSVY